MMSEGLYSANHFDFFVLYLLLEVDGYKHPFIHFLFVFHRNVLCILITNKKGKRVSEKFHKRPHADFIFPQLKKEEKVTILEETAKT